MKYVSHLYQYYKIWHHNKIWILHWAIPGGGHAGKNMFWLETSHKYHNALDK